MSCGREEREKVSAKASRRGWGCAEGGGMNARRSCFDSNEIEDNVGKEEKREDGGEEEGEAEGEREWQGSSMTGTHSKMPAGPGTNSAGWPVA